MNKIGFNVLAWSAGMSEELFPIIERLKKIGYDGVEFFVGSPDEAAYKQVGNFTRDLGLGVTTVTVVSPDQNPISESVAVRAKSLERIKWVIDRSYDLNSQILCGPFHSAHAHFAAHPALDEEYAWSAEVLHAAGEYAAQANIVLALEALNRFECYLCNTMSQLSRLVKLADHPNVRAMFDTHHANIEEKKYDRALATIAPVLSHVHISENDRGTPGDGHIPWDDAFAGLAAIHYKGWLTIEAFSRNDPDFANAIGVWREYNDPWHIAENGFTFIQQMCIKHNL
ncbi:sugar phosphate isomerase/epimerase family protein [Runella slithyformis]|uniref:Xylose isomerase domain-containing protein TIM barrel n=1 Tax=Runella slithyformis (strain ATCC 29530 / DSM 19594 / LMG 11500 / NCIMB 11436 / LSU 4) TaxID=761193 RepID=A0A7U3ZH84_RUNSL|nr:sugar phosphate isomerase/epimerase family protein [Runella slithyformis]AEI47092.1 Xylose isomerase domain-containing protein TIM barrel [Runella slithyformis DSM 19594]